MSPEEEKALQTAVKTDLEEAHTWAWETLFAAYKAEKERADKLTHNIDQRLAAVEMSVLCFNPAAGECPWRARPKDQP